MTENFILLYKMTILIYLKLWFRGESGYDFAIRTPCTPSRWNEFDTEMALAWEVSTPDLKPDKEFIIEFSIFKFNYS